MIHAGWIKPVVQGGLGRASLYDVENLQAAAKRIQTGEQPPLLPCELRRQPVLQLTDGSVRHHLPHRQAQPGPALDYPNLRRWLRVRCYFCRLASVPFAPCAKIARRNC